MSDSPVCTATLLRPCEKITPSKSIRSQSPQLLDVVDRRAWACEGGCLRAGVDSHVKEIFVDLRGLAVESMDVKRGKEEERPPHWQGGDS